MRDYHVEMECQPPCGCKYITVWWVRKYIIAEGSVLDV